MNLPTPISTEQMKELESKKGGCNRCPDFDDECNLVKDHYRCYMGMMGDGNNIGVAKGYCPFIHGAN